MAEGVKKSKSETPRGLFFRKRKKKRGFLTPCGQSGRRQNLLPGSYAGCIAKLLSRLTGNSNNKGYSSKKRRRRRIEMGWDKFLRWPSLWYKSRGQKVVLDMGGLRRLEWSGGMGWLIPSSHSHFWLTIKKRHFAALEEEGDGAIKFSSFSFSFFGSW